MGGEAGIDSRQNRKIVVGSYTDVRAEYVAVGRASMVAISASIHGQVDVVTVVEVTGNRTITGSTPW